MIICGDNAFCVTFSLFFVIIFNFQCFTSHVSSIDSDDSASEGSDVELVDDETQTAAKKTSSTGRVRWTRSEVVYFIGLTFDLDIMRWQYHALTALYIQRTILDKDHECNS